VGEEQMTLEEIQKFLDDNNTTLEEYLRENMITDEERKEFDQKWNALMVETLYRKFEDTP
jgi:DNA-binding transcriptional MerR regulator